MSDLIILTAHFILDGYASFIQFRHRSQSRFVMHDIVGVVNIAFHQEG